MGYRELEWSCPAQEAGENVLLPVLPVGSAQVGTQDLVAMSGVWNNCDVYLTADLAWITVFGAVITFNMFVEQNGQLFLVDSITNGSLGTLPNFQLLAGGFACRLFRVRGRPGEGFRVSMRITAPTAPPIFNPILTTNPIGSGRGTMVAWGTNTSETVFVASSAVGTSGAAPNNAVAVFVALTKLRAQRYVEISNDLGSGGILFVAFVALGIGASGSAPYQLNPGDTVRVEIDDASKVFVAGSNALVTYRLAVV
jgi:hypothetical protein